MTVIDFAMGNPCGTLRIVTSSGRHILVVDDDELLRDAIVEGLCDGGHTVRHACNGLEALAALKEFKADIIITDISMPEMDGLELISHLAESAPKAYRLIAMTAGYQSGPPDTRANTEDRRFVLLKVADTFGAERTLQKPFRMPQLLDLVAGIGDGEVG